MQSRVDSSKAPIWAFCKDKRPGLKGVTIGLSGMEAFVGQKRKFIRSGGG